MKDPEIRKELQRFLLQKHASVPDTLVRHEMGICAGRVRVDVAVVNHETHGYEIKSRSDSTARLRGQVEAYSQALDRATVVTDPVHLEKVDRIVPGWWGIIQVKEREDQTTLETVREDTHNPGVDPFAVAQMLWRDEAKEELLARGLAKGLSDKARHYLWVRLAENVDLEELRALTRERIRQRPTWWLEGGKPEGRERSQRD